MKLLKKLYAIYSPSEGEKKMKRFIKSWVRENVQNAKIYCENRNLYITKGESDTYPCVVAHLDQVQKNHSDDFTAVETRDIIFGYSPSNRRQEGLGADDKNGIWVALKCLQKYDAIKVAFFYGEEIGCLGSNRADLSFFDDVRFVIEPDRRGYNDLITSIGYQDICSPEFIEATDHEQFGYLEENGMMTDVETLRELGVTACCINLSCGYYEPHTDKEFTVKKDLINCLNFVQYIIENVTERMEFEDVYAPKSYGDGYRGLFDAYYPRNSRRSYCDDWGWERWCSPHYQSQQTKEEVVQEAEVKEPYPDSLFPTFDEQRVMDEVLAWDNFGSDDLEDFLYYCREYGGLDINKYVATSYFQEYLKEKGVAQNATENS